MTYRPYSAIIAEASSQNTSVKADYRNESGLAIPALNVVGVDSNGYISSINVSDEQTAISSLGIAENTINNLSEGSVVFSGRIENISTSFGFGKFLYVAKDGTLTDESPSIGINGFLSGDAIIRAGAVVRNRSNPSNKDLIVKVVFVCRL